MKIDIRHKTTRTILYEADALNLREAVENAVKDGANLGGVNLDGANLGGVNLGGAYLRGANLRGANLRGVNLRGAYLGGANLGGVNLGGAYLGGANLRGANLRGANLRGAYLGGANLRGVEGYSESHDIFFESIRRQKIEMFTDSEWLIIAQVSVHCLCWTSIKKRFGTSICPIFKKLAAVGFSEWLKRYDDLCKTDAAG